MRSRGHGRYTCTFSCGAGLRDVPADHVVFALPFTKLREVELHAARDTQSYAQQQYDRQTRLLASGIASRSQFDQAAG